MRSKLTKPPARCFGQETTTQTIELELSLTDRAMLTFYKMSLPVKTIRSFLKAVEWSTDTPFFMLGTGNADPPKPKKDEYRSILLRMSRVRRKPIKKLVNDFGVIIYADPETNRRDVGSFKLSHDIRLRECLARYIWDGCDMGRISTNGFADATLDFPDKKIYFELDNGHMDDKQLKEKLETNYQMKGRWQVIFFMAHRVSDHLERERLAKLFDIAKQLYPNEPNRVLGACYTDYLQDGKLFTWKSCVRSASPSQ